MNFLKLRTNFLLLPDDDTYLSCMKGKKGEPYNIRDKSAKKLKCDNTPFHVQFSIQKAFINKIQTIQNRIYCLHALWENKKTTTTTHQQERKKKKGMKEN